jgi:hypothetical protein
LSSFEYLLCFHELRIQRVEKHGGRHAGHRELRRAIQKTSAVDRPVHVLVEEVQKLLIEIRRSLSLHARDLHASRPNPSPLGERAG